MSYNQNNTRTMAPRTAFVARVDKRHASVPQHARHERVLGALRDDHVGTPGRLASARP